MSFHTRHEPGERASRTASERSSEGLDRASVEQTGNEDPGSELTELESAKSGERKDEPKQDRTIGNHPVDPNSMPGRIGLPIGVDKETAADPGRQTPEAPKTDNRS